MISVDPSESFGSALCQRYTPHSRQSLLLFTDPYVSKHTHTRWVHARSTELILQFACVLLRAHRIFAASLCAIGVFQSSFVSGLWCWWNCLLHLSQRGFLFWPFCARIVIEWGFSNSCIYMRIRSWHLKRVPRLLGLRFLKIQAITFSPLFCLNCHLYESYF